MQYVLSPGNLGSKEVSTLLIPITNFLFDKGLRVVGVPSSGKILNALRQGRIWRFQQLPWDESGSNWKHKDWNNSWSSSNTLGRFRSSGVCIKKIGCWRAYPWSHTWVRCPTVRRKVFHKSRKCHRFILCHQQQPISFIYPDGHFRRRHGVIQLHDREWWAESW